MCDVLDLLPEAGPYEVRFKGLGLINLSKMKLDMRVWCAASGVFFWVLGGNRFELIIPKLFPLYLPILKNLPPAQVRLGHRLLTEACLQHIGAHLPIAYVITYLPSV